MVDIPLVIIGAGPAGLSTALHLLQHDPGWSQRLILLDRSAHPRHKLCGGGLTRLGLDILKNLDLPDPLPIPQAPVHDARFVYRGRTVHVRGKPEFIVFHRKEFDHYLAQTALTRGLKIHENVRVLRIERSETGVIVFTDKQTYRAQAVVGADGSRGITRKALENVTRHRNPRVARLLEVVHPATGDQPQFDGAFAEFNFSQTSGELQGYAWDFPAQIGGAPHHNRGVYDARMVANRPRAPLAALLEQSLSSFGTDPETAHVEGHPIHWFRPDVPLSGDRLVLVGDAAGAEPLFGEGIAIALVYGKIAAGSIASAFNRGAFTFSDYKRRVLFSRLGIYLMVRWWVAWWSYRLSKHAWFMHSMWTIGKGLVAIKNTFSRG